MAAVHLNSVLFTSTLLPAIWMETVTWILLPLPTSYLPHEGPGLFILTNLGGLEFDQTLLLHRYSEIQSTSFTLNPSVHRAHDVKVADMDGDGDLDIVATLFDSSNGILMYYENDGTGTNFKQQILSKDLGGRGSIAIGDMDSDGDLDIVLLSKERKILWVLGNELASGGGFLTSVLDASVDGTHTIAVGDLMGNGHLDIVTGGLNHVDRYQNLGDRTFQKAATFETGTGDYCLNDICYWYYHIVVENVNGSGIGGDILATNGRNVVWFPQGGLTERTFISRSGQADTMAVSDLDGNGMNDVVVGKSYNIDAYFGGINGTIPPTPSPPPFSSMPGQVMPPMVPITYDPSNFVQISLEGTKSTILVADIDGDGLNDVLVGSCILTSDGGSDIVIFQGQGDGAFALPDSVYQGGNGRCASCCSDFNALAVGDLDGDGDLDIVAAASYIPAKGPGFFI